MPDTLEEKRLEYVYQQRLQINSNTFKVLFFYNTALISIAGASIALIGNGENISPSFVEIIQPLAVSLIILISLFGVTTIAMGILSWLDNKKEEVRIFKQAGINLKGPNLKGAWRWYETICILYIFASSICVMCFI